MDNSERPSLLSLVVRTPFVLAVVTFSTVIFAGALANLKLGYDLNSAGHEATAVVTGLPECSGGGMGGRHCRIDYSFETAGQTVRITASEVDAIAYRSLKLGAPIQIWYVRADPSMASTRSPIDVVLNALLQTVISGVFVAIGLNMLRELASSIRLRMS